MCAIVKEGFYKFTGMAKFDQSVTTNATRGEYFTDKLKKSREYSPLNRKASPFRRDTKRTYIQKEAILNKQKCFQKPK